MNTRNVKLETASPKRALLQTKLCMPRIRTQVVARPRLFAQLNHAITPKGTVRPKLSLITGPAGYGKTTLTTQWTTQLGSPVAWLSLDAGDNDESRFLAYLFAAIATVQEEIGEAALARLTTTYLYNDTESVLTTLMNDLAVCENQVVVVLDDYHLIRSDAVHQAVAFILQHMPVQLHMVIVSRSEPPLPVALLRARGNLTWINARDLRFSVDEASQFLSHTMGITLSESQISALDQQVEGWVTGLQLIALALQENVALPSAFSGNQRYLVDYLADQVLNRQPETIQRFLLQTAILPQFNADLCTHITQVDSQPMLEQIEAANLFLVPLDAERQWYRYHHLFADFLNGRLQQQKNQAEIASLHRKAAEWYYTHNQPLIAVDHALASTDYQMAVTLIEDVARPVLMHGEGSTLRQWVEALPVEMQTAKPSLTLFYAWALIREGEFSRAKMLLGEIADLLDSPILWGEWAALRARLAVITGDTDINISFSKKALSKLPADQHMLRSEVAINLGFSHLQQADLEAARLAFAEAAQNRAHDPGLWAVMFATFYWGQTYERQAQLQEAFDIYQRGLDSAEVEVNGRSPSPAVGFMHIGLGKILYEWNRLAEAETHIRRGLAYAMRSGDHKMLIYSREALAQLLTTVGDWAGAQAILNKLEQQIQSPGPSTRRAALAMQQGDLQTVQQWVRTMGIAIDDPPERMQELPFAFLELIKLRLIQREFEGVRAALQTLEAFADARNNTHLRIHIYLLQSILYAKQGEMETAVPRFRQTLNLAAPGKYVRLFINHQGATLARLLHQAANNRGTAVPARALLTHLNPTLQTEEPVIIQPLSTRELEVLHHLADGLTNREIAAQMVISLNTVKAHTRRLYEKLGVNNRTQAVARARDARLLKQ